MLKKILFLISLMALIFFTSPIQACSRILWNSPGPAVMVGRTMDWEVDTQSNFWLLPRGMKKTGSSFPHALMWTSKYGSVILAAYDHSVLDGLNEKGLAGHLLWLNTTDYGAHNPKLPNVALGLWLQFYLDNFTTVHDALLYTQQHPFQILPTYFKPAHTWIKLHLALEDATGDSAIIEFVQGKIHVYHARAYTVLTNTPDFPSQLANAKQYIGLGGKKALPGSELATDRFVRASYGINNMPQTHSLPTQLAMLASLLNNVAEPFATPSAQDKDSTPTFWWSIADLTHRTYYFKSIFNPNMVWVKLNTLDFSPGSPVRKLTLVNHPELVGDVSKQFLPTPLFKINPPSLTLDHT